MIPPTCLAMLSLAGSLTMGDSAVASHCMAVDLDVAGRVSQTWPDPGIARRFTLPRARLSLGIAQHGAGARLQLGAVRSAGEGSYIGVDGESLLAQVQVAEARYLVPRWGLGVAAGLVDTAWVVSGDDAWGFRALAPVSGERNGLFTRSDLGATASWTSPGDWASLSLTVSSGEGHQRRERNDGQNVALWFAVRADQALPDDVHIELQGLLRDGSRGLRFVRDHRAGARLLTEVGAIRGGVEWVRAWGLDGVHAAEPTAWSLWSSGQVWGPVQAVGRVDRVGWQPGVDDASSTTTWLGGGLDLPVNAATDQTAPGRVLIAWQSHHDGPGATALAGAAGMADTHTLLLQLELGARGEVPLASP